MNERISSKNLDIIDTIIIKLKENTRGNEIAINTVAGLGFAFAIYKIRPFSKFSRVVDVPKHFIKNKIPIKGKIVGYEHSSNCVKLLFNHHPLINIPFWHSNKAPLPVEVWGIKPVGNNTFSWLQTIAFNYETSVIPLKQENDILYAQINVKLPVFSTSVNSKKEKLKKGKIYEELNIAEHLLEIGLGKINEEVAKCALQKNWWIPWENDLKDSAVLQRAQHIAISHRAGYWQTVIPPTYFQSIIIFFKRIIISMKKSKIQLSTLIQK